MMGLLSILSFLASPLGRKIALYVAIIVAALSVFLVIDRHGYNRGYAKAIAQIAIQNQQAVNLAQSIRGKIQKCFDGGGEWNLETGACDKP